MKKTLAIGLVGLTALSAGVVAYGGMFENTELQTAVNDGDYDSFVESLSAIDPDAAERMNEDRFEHIQNRFHVRQQVQDAIDDEDYEAFVDADSRHSDITEEAFLELVARHNAHEAIELAVEARDYDAWVEAVSSLPHGENMADIVDEDEFESFIEMREEREGFGNKGPGNKGEGMRGGHRGHGMV